KRDSGLKLRGLGAAKRSSSSSCRGLPSLRAILGWGLECSHLSAHRTRATASETRVIGAAHEGPQRPDVLSATAARMSALSAFSSILSPSWKSMARRVLPSRLELNRPDGSASDAPLAKVSFTAFLYVSPVQIIPACDHTGTPDIAFDGFLHFTSSITSGSACLMRSRTRASVSPRQSVRALILASIC